MGLAQHAYSQAERVKFGAKLDSSGHISQSTVLPAIERVAASKYGDAVAAQANTWAGARTRLQGFLASVQGIANAIGPVIGLIAGAAAQFSIVGEHGRNAAGTLQTIGRFLALDMAGFVALRVVQTAYNAIMVVTDAPMNATPICLVVLAIAALTAGFVLAYEKIKPCHMRCQVAVVNRIVRAAFAVGYALAMGSMILLYEATARSVIVRGARVLRLFDALAH
jgi:hypothetical protein